jgi:hypothetical protein
MGFTHASLVDAELSEVFEWHSRPGAELAPIQITGGPE